ncbi:MAG: glycogen debranching enzyme, partial [Planctomycetota bacterium]|nr:glycogen debranching enzyme [Planctomycetota bacterium]
EWNGFYRDEVRLFWKGQKGMVSRSASRLCGSDDLYKSSGRRPTHSINFITSHDGFTLADLVSYERKHNEDNGENNRDGEIHNHSQNFGVEGPTQDARILRLREKQRKNFLAVLFLSQGVPMLLAGDEFGRTQHGNNNAYCQDNEIGWVNWRLASENAAFLRFVRLLIAFRKRHPALRRQHFFEGGSDISWQGERAYQPDWSAEARHLAFLIDGSKAASGRDCYIFAMFNANEDWRHFEIPHVGKEWRRVIDTSRESPEDIVEDESHAPAIGFHHNRYGIEGRSVVVLVAK